MSKLGSHFHSSASRIRLLSTSNCGKYPDTKNSGNIQKISQVTNHLTNTTKRKKSSAKSAKRSIRRRESATCWAKPSQTISRWKNSRRDSRTLWRKRNSPSLRKTKLIRKIRQTWREHIFPMDRYVCKTLKAILSKKVFWWGMNTSTSTMSNRAQQVTTTQTSRRLRLWTRKSTSCSSTKRDVRFKLVSKSITLTVTGQTSSWCCSMGSVLPTTCMIATSSTSSWTHPPTFHWPSS